LQGIWPIKTIERGEGLDVLLSQQEEYDFEVSDPFSVPLQNCEKLLLASPCLSAHLHGTVAPNGWVFTKFDV
jgi:hypothetical protein